MSGNSIGKSFVVTSFGESHGPALGCIVDGCPPGLPLTEEDLQRADHVCIICREEMNTAGGRSRPFFFLCVVGLVVVCGVERARGQTACASFAARR